MPSETAPPTITDGRRRAVIDAVAPCVDGGRFAIKRVAGETVVVESVCFADGHDALRVLLQWRPEGASSWHEVEMQPRPNDGWRGQFVAGPPGHYRYTVTAWVDRLLTWRNELARRTQPEDIAIAARVGADLIAQTAARADAGARARLQAWAAELERGHEAETLKAIGLDPELGALGAGFPDRRFATRWPLELPLVVDRMRARFGAWYEMFPRSAASSPGRHGTFRDVEARLPYVAELGFDVLYLPPIHPIGRERRKGRNGALDATPDDVGSPWAVGAREGGHKSIHPQLGTLEDFRRLLARAGEHGIEIALDIAFQCAPDHPYVSEHPQWFCWRPDGTVQYAENPPKKYQDIYPFDFESGEWHALWAELKSVFDFWIDAGVRIFRVDNPHTKAFPFWEWVIGEVKRDHHDVLFLAEAFTRPAVMHRLAKLGFTQSYTYFAWRNTKRELTDYFTELTQGPGREYFRPNAWPNTPDILTEALQFGGRAAFMTRVVLAATLAASYGIYGPAFELMEQRPREPGSEEYLDSEKYQLRSWDVERPDSLRSFVALVNRIRRENPALQSDWSLRFFPTDDDGLLCYAKQSGDGDNAIVCVVNLDPHHAHAGWVELDLARRGIEPDAQYQMHDLLSGARFLWHGARNFVRLDPARSPAHVFRLLRRARHEQDFDYFL